MSLVNEDIIEKILARELKMFLSVPSARKSSCQDYPESFKLHRKAQFSCWSRDTLESYLSDLEKAEEKGINLMTHKYARMDNLIPQLNSNPLIDKIVGVSLRVAAVDNEKISRNNEWRPPFVQRR